MRQILFALAVVSLTACQSGGSAGPDTALNSDEEDATVLEILERGEPWEVVSLAGIDEMPRGSRAHLQFLPAERLTGNAGCNTLNGRFSLEEGVLRFSGLATTRMACPGPLATVEAGFLEALRNAHGLELDEDRLTLLDESGATLATLNRSPQG